MIELSPDSSILWQWKFITLNYTIIFTWLVMALLITISLWGTKNLKNDGKISKWQNILETIIFYLREQIRQIMGTKGDLYLPFLGTLFLFISLSNLLAIVPLYHPPTASLSTTAALAVSVYFAVPIFGILNQGLKSYLKHYTEPTILMLPFHILGELTRTLALAMRLFGNIMSEGLIASVLLVIVPLFFPVLLELLGLIIGQVQAYIFAVLATIYVASAIQVTTPKTLNNKEK
jgi:F-type H+-transporting ATPase subunit a